jgi:hypothetical protein
MISLIPRPIPISQNGFDGKLFVWADLDSNYIFFNFKFDREENRAPLVVFIEADSKVYSFPCGRESINRDIMKSEIFDPGFRIKPDIRFLGVNAWLH